MFINIKEKINTPIIQLFKSGNLEFILSFFYGIYRNWNEQIDSIKQSRLEKRLEFFIKDFNENNNDDKKEESAGEYIESWINKNYLRRFKISEFDDEFDIELSDYSNKLLLFFDSIWEPDIFSHSSVKSTFENAILNLKDIALSSSENQKQNLLEIDKQIEKLNNKKELIKSGDLKIFEDEVYDKYTLVKELLQKLPWDFRNIEKIFSSIAIDIQKDSNEIDVNKWKILWETLEKIESRINNSPQWKSFDGFNQFYMENNSELFSVLKKIFKNYDKIQEAEKNKWIIDMIELDLLKSKKRATKKKGFILSRLREVFNEKALLEKRSWMNSIKNIKKIIHENISTINLKKELISIETWFDIDLFLWKNFWKWNRELNLKIYNDVEKKENEISLEEIFKYSPISERKIKENIDNLLKNKDEIILTDVLNNYPIENWLDEFMSYFSILDDKNWEIIKENNKTFWIKWIKNDLVVKSSEIKFKK